MFQLKKSLGITNILLLVFGREALEQSCQQLKDAFAHSFNRDLRLSSWRKYGSVPLTRSALQSNKIMHQVMYNADGTIDTESDPETPNLLGLKECNHFVCDFLSTVGYDGSQLQIDAPRKKKATPLTQSYTKERQEAILQAQTAGQLFHATGGTMLNLEDIFRARASLSQKKEIKELESKLKYTSNRAKIRLEALEIRMPQAGASQNYY
jgi:hypothetical protein